MHLDGDDVTLCCEPRPPKTKAAAKDKANKKTREELDAEELEEDCGLRGGDVIVKRSAQFEIEPTVHGGLESAIGAWPWAAALGRVRIGGRFTTVCGGTLISNRHILTATHCFPENPRTNEIINKVRLGDHNLVNGRDGVTPLDVDICDTKLHKKYALMDGVKNDIAILTLCQNVTYTQFIQPACLPFGYAPETNLFMARYT